MVYDNKLYQEDLISLAQENLEWDALKGKGILVTGASGMIGTFLIDVLMKRNELFQSDISIYALSRNIEKLKKKFEHYTDQNHLYMIEQDVAKEFCLKNDSINYIIHGASNTHPKEYSGDPVGTITTNVFGLYYLLEYMKNHKNCRLIVLSSVEVYGENRGDVSYFNEDYCGYINCNTLRAGYPESKRLSEALLQAYIAQYQIDGVLVRLGRVYGPTVEKDDSKAISQFIHKAVSESNIVLKSEGNQRYSYSYVSDAVQAILYCMLKGKCGEAYNVADNASNATLRNIAEYLAEIAERKVVFELPDENEKRGYSTATKALMDSGKIQKLGWKARYSIQDGLKRTILILKDERR